MAQAILHITNKSDYINLINNNACIVKFTAEWCNPCKKIAPLYQRLAEENSEHIVFLEVDIDPAPEITKLESIQAVPRFVFYYKGEELKHLSFSGGNSNLLINNVKCFLNELEELKKKVAEVPIELPLEISPELPSENLSSDPEDGLEFVDEEEFPDLPKIPEAV